MKAYSLLLTALLLLVPAEVLAYTYSYAPTIPTTNTSTGTTTQPLNGVVGNCLSISATSVGTPAPLLNLDCSGNLGVAGTIAGGGGGGVSAVTGSGNIMSSGGTTPNVTITDSPTFTGTVTADTVNATNSTITNFSSSSIVDTSLSANTCVATNGGGQLASGGLCVDSVSGGSNINIGGTGFAPVVNLNSDISVSSVTASGLTPGNCVQAGAAGLLTTTGSACGGGGGGVSRIAIPYAVNNRGGAPFQGAGYANFWADPSSNATDSIDAYGGFPTHTVLGATINCLPYNATLEASAPGQYPYTSPTASLYGGTLTFVSLDSSDGTAYPTVGTLTLPNCTTSGACTTQVTSIFGTPFVASANTSVNFYVSASGTVGSPFQNCVVTLLGN